MQAYEQRVAIITAFTLRAVIETTTLIESTIWTIILWVGSGLSTSIVMVYVKDDS